MFRKYEDIIHILKVEKRNFRAVGINLNHSISTEELKLEIEKKGHRIRIICNIK